MYSRHEIAMLLGYDYDKPETWPDEATAAIDRLITIEAEHGQSAMVNEAAAILRTPREKPPEPEPHEFCCDELRNQDEYFEENNDPGKWNVLGCCKHCYVLTGVRFCPFCGTEWGKQDDD